jgi:hypothetical protein
MKLKAIRIGSLLAMCTLVSALGCAVETADASDRGEVGEDYISDVVRHPGDTAEPVDHAPPVNPNELKGAAEQHEAARRPGVTQEPFLHAVPVNPDELTGVTEGFRGSDGEDTTTKEAHEKAAPEVTCPKGEFECYCPPVADGFCTTPDICDHLCTR